jgi:hypothetical protein
LRFTGAVITNMLSAFRGDYVNSACDLARKK